MTGIDGGPKVRVAVLTGATRHWLGH